MRSEEREFRFSLLTRRFSLLASRSSLLTYPGLREIPRGVWALGFVSLFMDISSEMIHGLLPVFLITVLGASTEVVGLIEGVGEATASVSKLGSGWLSDKLGKRKALTVLGYGLGAVSKPLFAIAPTAFVVLGARFSDRVGKGIRGAPRDAMIGEMVQAGQRGASYGLRQALDSVGAFTGPLLAIVLMAVLHDNFRLIFWLAVIPGGISVLILMIAVREPQNAGPVRRAAIELRDLKAIGGGYWLVAGIGVVLTLARFSEAFLILRAQNAGLSLALAPLVLVVMNIVYSLSAYPLGWLSDRIDRRLMLAAGFATLIAADVVLAAAPNLAIVMIGVALWGLHMGMTQGLLSAVVADESPAHLRATAFGVFNFASGFALLLASLVAGVLWEQIGPAATFIAGAVFTAVGLSILFVTRGMRTVA
ncbi:MAG TPA: MFS transporter [Micropepsaceae bacterium]|nr:MFS transporter [Micropepsaceae bacterium]